MMSYFSQCSEILGGTYDSNIKALILLKKRVIHVLRKLQAIMKYDIGIATCNAYYNLLAGNTQNLIMTS